jgi:hypothetical protein
MNLLLVAGLVTVALVLVGAVRYLIRSEHNDAGTGEDPSPKGGAEYGPSNDSQRLP